MKNFIIGVYVGCTVFSCTTEKSSIKLVDRIEGKCNKIDPCRLYIRDIIDINWDKMFVFQEGASLEFINSKIGFNYPFFTDIAKRIIFVKGNQVVYHEDEFPSIETPDGNELFFIFPDSTKYLEFSRESANFIIQKTRINNKFIYRAAQIN